MYKRLSGLTIVGIVFAEFVTQLLLRAQSEPSSGKEEDEMDTELRNACVARSWATVVKIAPKLSTDELNAALSPDGWRALHFAAAAGAEEAVRALLEAGADCSVQAKAGSTALHLATWEGRESTVIALLGGGVKVDATTAAGRTPLHFAAHRGHANIARRLVGAGADVNAMERDGRQPLHFAAREGYSHVVRVMVDAGASGLVMDKNGVTPVMAAEKAGHGEVVATIKTRNVMPNNEAAVVEKSVPAPRKRTAGGGWATISRTVSDMTSMFTRKDEEVVEGRTKDDSSAITRGEVYAVVGAGVLVSALIPVVRSAVREG